MARDVLPYLVPDPALVRASAWQRQTGGEPELLTDCVPDWDYRTQLVIDSTVEADPVEVREACHLDDGSPIVWAVSWRATDTGLLGPATSVSFTAGIEALRLTVNPMRAGATLVLTRRLVLARDRPGARPGEAARAGSVLWSDYHTVRLIGDAAMFPVEVVDFRALRKPSDASWYLNLPASADEPAMGSVQLLINESDRELVEAITRRAAPSDAQSVLVGELEEGVALEIVRWAVSRWDELVDAEDGSFGAAARDLTRRVVDDPRLWSTTDDAVALRAAVVSGARAVGLGRILS